MKVAFQVATLEEFGCKYQRASCQSDVFWLVFFFNELQLIWLVKYNSWDMLPLLPEHFLPSVHPTNPTGLEEFSVVSQYLQSLN